MINPYELLRCPESGDRLEQAHDHLFTANDQPYPFLAGTWIVHPDNRRFLREELWSISRAMAVYGVHADMQDWYMEHFATWNVPDPMTIDTAVAGEGYPEYWDYIDYPDFMEPLIANPPESRIINWVKQYKPKVALDLGAGQGGMTYRMARICKWVLGIEQNVFLSSVANHQMIGGMLDIRQRRPEFEPLESQVEIKPVENATVLCADATRLPIAPASVDWLHAGHLIDLLDDPMAALEHWFERLKPGGLISIATPWDTAEGTDIDAIEAYLEERCETLHAEDDVPWVRVNHNRRFVVHNDWLMVGRFRG